MTSSPPKKFSPKESLAMDPRSIRERHGKHLERLEALARKVREKRAGAYEAAIRHAELHPPSVEKMKSDKDALRQAIKRGQVRRIARVASPRSKDEGSVFTADRSRYALTDLYKPTARERVGLLKERTTRKTSSFWDAHKTKIVLGAVGLTAIYLFYVTAARAKERTASGPQRGRHLTGFYPAALPGHLVGAYYRRHPSGVAHRQAAASSACPSNIFDANMRCHSVNTSHFGKKTVGDPSPRQNSNFDDKGGTFCQCWANVDTFGNIQDHNTCYPSKDDANSKTNGFPGRPADFQGGDYFSSVPCPAGGVKTTAPSAPATKTGYWQASLPAHAVGWEHGRWPSEHMHGEDGWPREHRHQEHGWWPGEHHRGWWGEG